MIYKQVHTLPLYESVEALQVLPNFHHYCSSGSLKNKVTKNNIVIATAGAKGTIRSWKTTHKEGDANQLSRISGLIRIAEQEEKSAFGQKRGGYTGLLLTSHKHQLCQNLPGINEDENLKAHPEELIAVDAEHNLSFLNHLDVQNKPTYPPLLGLNRTIIGHNDEILDLKIIPDPKTINDTDQLSLHNKRVAIATNSAQIRVFDLATYSCVVLDGHTETVLTLEVSPCGKFIATSGKDKTTRIWDLNSQKCVSVATGHTEAIGATALSRKIGRYEVAGKAAENGAGSFLVTASRDKTLKRWNLPGSSVLEDIGLTDKDNITLSVFCSVSAHEKLSKCLSIIRFFAYFSF